MDLRKQQLAIQESNRRRVEFVMHHFWKKVNSEIAMQRVNHPETNFASKEDLLAASSSSTNDFPMTKEAQAAMEKACELFVLELTVLAWSHAPLSHDEGAQQFHALTKDDVKKAIFSVDQYDAFLHLL